MPKPMLRRSLRWRRPLRLPSLRSLGKRRSSGGSGRRISPFWLTVLLTALAFVAIVIWLETHIRPLILQVAEARVYYLASTAINESIVERLARDDVQYDSLIQFEKDYSGQITALKTDMMTINRLKAGITEDILQALRHMDPSELTIPVGNVIGSDFFSGRGPGIPFRIVPYGTVSAEFTNRFTAAGINQTRHQIMLNITVDISVLLIGSDCSQTVRAEMSVAETVIVGAVPDHYLSFDGEAFADNGEQIANNR